MSEPLIRAVSAATACGVIPLWGQSMWDGKWVFVGALVAVLVWLLVLPARLVGVTWSGVPWWRNVRLWAMIICAIQIYVYWWFG